MEEQLGVHLLKMVFQEDQEGEVLMDLQQVDQEIHHRQVLHKVIQEEVLLHQIEHHQVVVEQEQQEETGQVLLVILQEILQLDQEE